MRRPIVFLHLPKTAGQTIHHAIGALVGETAISPYRAMDQVGARTVFPPEYQFHSGHLNWVDLDKRQQNPFVFTVLRDPRERFASFYFFRRDALSKYYSSHPNQRPNELERAILGPPEALFFSSDPGVSDRINFGWANQMTTYLSLRRLGRGPGERHIAFDEHWQRIEKNLRDLDAIYRFGDFSPLEDDIEALWRERPKICATKANCGPLPKSISRWDALLSSLGSDRLAAKMDRFIDEDDRVWSRLQPNLNNPRDRRE